MKITFKDIQEISEDHNPFQKFKSRKRKLSANYNVNKLLAVDKTNNMFNTADLEELRFRGILDELVKIVQRGKEATVYLGRCTDLLLAVKIYTDLRVRSFRRDDIYRQGRFVGNARIEKAIAQGSEKGLNAHQILWVQEEFRQMSFLYKEGIPVPRPVAISGLVVLMEFIGTEEEAAPRISDLHMDKDEAQDAFNQSIKILENIVSLGRIHSDYSAYNILWHEEKAVLIDFPQVVEIDNNVSAKELLHRDVTSLCRSFKKFKIAPDPERIFRRLVSFI